MAGSGDNSISSVPANDNIEWTVQNQVQLLLALMGHKPVGVAKYFQMACILEKFSNAIRRYDISSKVIWDRLETMYDLQALEETEAIPFPNETQEFSLPEALYGTYLEQKRNGTMPPPPVPSPPPEIKREETKEIKKEPNKDSISKKDFKEVTRKADERKFVPLKDIKKEPKEDSKKDKKNIRESVEDKKKDKDAVKNKDLSFKDQRGVKRGAPAKDDEDLPLVISGSMKRGREKDISDTEDAPTPKRSSLNATNINAMGGKAKRQTRLSHAKASDDSGSNKSVSPVTVTSPSAKRRRHV